MVLSRFVVLLLVALGAAPALAAPDAVLRSEAAMRDSCKQGGGQPAVRPGLVTEIDLNGDGQPDYIVDGNKIDCRGGSSLTCGSGGCLAEIFVSTPAGYRPAFQDNVYGFLIDRTKQPPSLRVQWHKFHCDKTGLEGCVQGLTWNGRQLVAGSTATTPRPQPPAGQPPGGAEWSLRYTNNVPIAFSPGQDPLRELVVVCGTSGRPFLGVVFLKAPGFLQAAVSLVLAGRRFDVRTASAPGNANVFLADIGGTELLAALPQARDPIGVTVNGSAMGTVAGAGAAAQLRTALAPCQRN